MKEQNLQSFCRYRHGGVPMAIGMKVETMSVEAAAQAGKEGGGSEFTISLPT